MKTAYCYLSIELDTELAGEMPLDQIQSALEDLAVRISELDDTECFEETLTIREGRKRIGEAEITVREEDPTDAN